MPFTYLELNLIIGTVVIIGDFYILLHYIHRLVHHQEQQKLLNLRLEQEKERTEQALKQITNLYDTLNLFAMPAVRVPGRRWLHSTVLCYAASGAVCYLAICFIIGAFLKNLAASPYDGSVLGIFNNLVYILPALFATELVRAYTLGAVWRCCNRRTVMVVLITAALFLADLNYGRIVEIDDFQTGFIYAAQNIAPQLTQNILLSVLVFYGGAPAGIVYMGTVQLFQRLFPFLPSLPCKLGLVPEEADTVKLIFSEFLKNNSLTKTDAVLLVQGCLTKNRKRFTRFAIKNILINPVYMTADEDAYDYLQKNNVELFSEKAAFDGEHGLMAYNRTLQKAGRANQIRPMSDWIVSVGNHPGLISGVQWVKVQQMLNQNKSKAYRKPRSNVALLSGLLICGDCGEFMRPKMTNRVTADSEQFYTYMCTLKERSKSQCCHIRNVNGNQLDKAIIEQVKQLSEDNGEFMQQLEKGRKSLKGNQEEYEQRLSQLQAEQHGNEEQIKALVLSLTKAAGTAAEEYIMRVPMPGIVVIGECILSIIF